MKEFIKKVIRAIETFDSGAEFFVDPVYAGAGPKTSIEKTETNDFCFRCDAQIPRVFPDFPEATNLDNALTVELHGGYGEFTDCLFDCPALRVILCHKCSHYLCEFLDVSAKDWHTHSSDLDHKDL